MKISKQGNYIIITTDADVEIYNAHASSTDYGLSGTSVVVYDKGSDVKYENSQAKDLVANFKDENGVAIVGGVIDWLRTNTGFNPASGGSGAVLQQITVSLSALQIKSLGTTPIDAIATPVAGKYIKISSVDAWLTWGTVAFTENPILIKTNGLANEQINISGLLGSIANAHKTSSIALGASGIFLANTKLVITGTDSILTGDSTLDVYITYETITL